MLLRGRRQHAPRRTERLVDLLNEETGFVPFETHHEDGTRTVLFNRDHIVLIVLDDNDASFKDALRAALREDPDIVLVGELRDLETVAIAIETAETGHLVFGTLHTTTAASTVDRLVDQFPADRQAQIRIMLSESLRDVIAQNLCRKIGGGRVAALEVLIATQAITNLIREGKTFQIPSIRQVGKAVGLVTLNDALTELVTRKLVAPDEAFAKAFDKSGFEGLLKRLNITLDVKPKAAPAMATA
jgi:twitching motility protein PilT